jgi:hypothetical protein
MDGGTGSVSMGAYWNNVATPLLLFTIGFGLFAIFTVNQAVLLPPSSFTVVSKPAPPTVAVK